MALIEDYVPGESPLKKPARKSRKKKFTLEMNHEELKQAESQSPSRNIPIIEPKSKVGEISMTKFMNDSILEEPPRKEPKKDEQLYTLE